MYDISGIQAEHPTRTCGLMKYQMPCTIDRRPRNREIFVANGGRQMRNPKQVHLMRVVLMLPDTNMRAVRRRADPSLRHNKFPV